MAPCHYTCTPALVTDPATSFHRASAPSRNIRVNLPGPPRSPRLPLPHDTSLYPLSLTVGAHTIRSHLSVTRKPSLYSTSLPCTQGTRRAESDGGPDCVRELLKLKLGLAAALATAVRRPPQPPRAPEQKEALADPERLGLARV
jgi:hypothetical protein